MKESVLGGIATLEVLRPPEGYRTRAALATTYSADLVAATAALMALNGEPFDGIATATKLPDVLRAIRQLRGSVRIAAQRGRLTQSGPARTAALGLLDRLVREVPFDEHQRSFHPKVWIVRQAAIERPDRFVLMLGSRNLTSSPAWDLGITLIGSSKRIPSGRRLSGLDSFVRRVCELIDDPGFRKTLGRLDEVYWRMPRGVTWIGFGFAPGDSRRALPPALLELPQGARVLLISPFLDADMVRRSAALWGDCPDRRLVAGRLDLDRLAGRAKARRNPGGAAMSARDALLRLGAHHLDIAGDATSPTPRRTARVLDDATVDAEDAETVADRGLHAKIATIWTSSRRATVLLGSPNLTRRAWTGANTEAWMTMEASSDLADGLWKWSNRATPYVPPELGEATPPPKESVLEGLRKDLAATRLRLVESLQNHRVLEGVLMARPAPPRANVIGVQRRVSRLSVPHEEVLWPFTRDRVRLPGCSPGARTAFVVLRLTTKHEELSWIQTAKVSPAIGEARDDAAPAELLDAAGFSEYFRGFLGGESSTGADDGPPDASA